MPVDQGLHRADVAEVALWNVMIVERRVALQSVIEVFAGAKAYGVEHVADASVEAFDHAVGLWSGGFDQAMLDGVLGAEAIERVAAGGRALAGGAEAVGELLAVVGQQCGDFERGGGEQALEETAGAGGGLVRQAFEVDPAGGAVDGDEQIRALVLVGHLRQVFDIHVHEAGGVVLEALGGRLGRVLLGQEVGQARDAVTAQAAVQARARGGGVEELPDHREQVIEGQQRGATQFHRHRLLRRCQRGLEPVRAVRGVAHVLACAPLGDGGRGDVVALGQGFVGAFGRLQFAPDGRRRASVLVQVDDHLQQARSRVQLAVGKEVSAAPCRGGRLRLPCGLAPPAPAASSSSAPRARTKG